MILIDGKPVEPVDASIVETEPGVYSVLLDGVSYEAWVSGNEIAVAGHRFGFEIEDPRQWKRSAAAVGAQGLILIVAPMPGKIVRVLAHEGDNVTAGQGIIIVEAMKMQNELKSPRDGRVTAIGVKENESVNAGTVLATIA